MGWRCNMDWDNNDALLNLANLASCKLNFNLVTDNFEVKFQYCTSSAGPDTVGLYKCYSGESLLHSFLLKLETWADEFLTRITMNTIHATEKIKNTSVF